MSRCLHIEIHESPREGRRHTRRTHGAGISGPDDPETMGTPSNPDDPETMGSPSNPDHPETMGAPSNPDHPETMGAPSNPDHPETMGTPSNPTSGIHAWQDSPWAPEVTASWGSSPHTAVCCCPPAAGTAAGAYPAPAGGFYRSWYSGFVIVRLAAGILDGTAESLWRLAKNLGLGGLEAVLEVMVDEGSAGVNGGGGDPQQRRTTGGRERAEDGSVEAPPIGTLSSRPLIDLDRTWSVDDCAQRSVLGGDDRLDALAALEQRAAVTRFAPLHSLAAYWRVDARRQADRIDEIVGRFNALGEVDLAYPELRASEPGAAGGSGDLSGDQSYLDDAPVGISARWALDRIELPVADRLAIVDLEQGWNPTHRDFKTDYPQLQAPIYGDIREDDPDHGTAVLGQLAAKGAGELAVSGAVRDLARFRLVSHYKKKVANAHQDPEKLFYSHTNGHVASAIANALLPLNPKLALPKQEPLQPGDVLLLEVQRGLLPTEIDAADFDAIRLASALGVIVIEAAGNGGYDLDRVPDPGSRRPLNRRAAGFRDSGALLVGAAWSALPHDRARFSNFGSRVDCYGWGDTVTTTGYGDLHSGSHQDEYYTNTFSGTSSAAPIIAAAAAILQCLHTVNSGPRLLPGEMRALLADPATGTPQGPNVPGRIGVMPDLRAIVGGRLQLTPELYLRRWIGDDGSPPPRDRPVTASPDILLPANPMDVDTRFGEGGPRADDPAPGSRARAGEKIQVFLRLRNRGLCADEKTFELFAGPAATLLLPEHWRPIGRLTTGCIAQGDLLTVSGSVPSPNGNGNGLQLGASLAWTPAVFDAVLPPQLPAGWTALDHSLLAVWDREAGEKVGWGAPRCLLPPGTPYFDWRSYRRFQRAAGVYCRNVHPAAIADRSVSGGPGRGADLSWLVTGTHDVARRFDLELIQRLPKDARVTLTIGAAFAAKLRQRQSWLRGEADGPENYVRLELPERPRLAISGVDLPACACLPALFTVEQLAPQKPGDRPLGNGHSLAIRQLWRGEEVGRITWHFHYPTS